MAAIKIFRPQKNWSVQPRTLLPTALLYHLFQPHSNYTVVLDDHPVGKIGNDDVRVFEVEPGEHRLRIRFVGLRTSDEMRMSLKVDEERQFLCGTSQMGWPTLREASTEEVAETGRAPGIEAPKPGDPTSAD